MIAFTTLLPILQVPATLPRDLTPIVVPIVQNARLPALGAAVVTSEGLAAIGVAGVRSWGGSTRVTPDDRWHIGSCTKAMTATLVARLIERGVLDWTTTVGAVFGPTVHPAWRPVTMVWLLSHRSGAPLNFDDQLWQRMARRGGTPSAQRGYVVEEGLKVAPSTTPNTKTIYSNLGFIVAGVMLERLTGSSWEDLMAREVFEPLGMRETGFGAPGTPGRLDQPLGHVRGDNGWSPVPPGPHADNPAAAGPTGTIHTSLKDWARFVGAHLRGERGDQSYLTTASWKRLHTPAESDWGYSPGWVVGEAPGAGGRVLRHLGSNNFWIAEAVIAPGRDFAVLLVTNVGDDAAEAPFKQLLARLIADQPTRPAN